jgi:hypothetical protein
VTGLQPLEYHVDVAGRLSRLEPAGWHAFTSAPETTASGDLHAGLARTAYRLDPAAHPRVAAAVAAAAGALGVEVPVTVYQLEGGPGSNAALLHRRSEAVVTLGGDLLERLTDAELAALFGHELGHHRLWTLDGGWFGVADRMLDALAAHAGTPEPFLETGRRWNLATELFADRCALAACGDVTVTVSCLVKAATGLREVDPSAFLHQAETADPASGSRGRTHPETVLRAWALHRWNTERCDASAITLLRPGLDLDRLDLADREALEHLTRQLVEAFLAPAWSRTDLMLAHTRAFFPDLVPGPPMTSTPPTTNTGPTTGTTPTTGTPAAVPPVPVPPIPSVPPPAAADLPETTRRFLGYVLLDLATVDPDLEDRPLIAAQELAGRLGFGEIFAELVRAELTEPARARRTAARRTGPGRSVGVGVDGRRSR